MKTKFFYIFFLMVTFAACERIMDKKDLGQISSDDIWASPVLADAYLNKIMAEGIPGYESDLMSHTEEGFSVGSIQLVTDIVPVDNNVSGNIDRWSYGTIRKINRFLENIDKSVNVSDKNKADYKAQMYTLRAFLYFEMVRAYGGIPLTYYTLTPGEDELALPREKTSVCIDSIVSDLNKAIVTADFPMNRDVTAAGRISKAAAYALKGRVLLTYASPQYSKETPAGTKPADQRWTEAYNACKEAQNQLTQAGYGLYRPNPATPEEAMQNYYSMFVNDECNEEIIWVRRYAPEPSFATPGRGGNGENGYPTLEMALAFAKADGTPYSGISMPAAQGVPDIPLERSYEPYWLNREPRFYAAIAYNGCDFPLVRNNQVAVSEDIENGKMKHFWMMKRSVVPGNDAQQWDGINSFRIRKRYDLNINYSGQPDAQYVNQYAGTDYPLIRYAEVVLNLAEAAAKTGKEQEALELLYSIRKRAGIPAGDGTYGIGSPSGNSLIAAILNERLVELCFEGIRFHDVRRWRLYTDDLVPGAATIREGKKLNGLVRHDMISDALNQDGSIMTVTDHIEKVFKPLAVAEFDINTQAGANLYFQKFRNDISQHETDAAKFAFSEREYFLRIPYEAHIKTNPNIEQTQGWTDSRGPGTFNPYE
mgnify:CR=1 FL=1